MFITHKLIYPYTHTMTFDIITGNGTGRSLKIEDTKDR